MKKEGFIVLKEARFRANHGVLPQEKEIGGSFVANLKIGYDMSAAAKSDNIEDAIDYSALYEILEREIHTNSRLLENLAARIANSLLEKFSKITSIDLEILKENPPLRADLAASGVEIHIKKDIENTCC